MRATVLEGIGFFHFVDRFETPVAALTGALNETRKRQNLSGSLIVLPEAFNLGHGYDQGKRELSCCGILDQLRKLAALHCVAFIAGMLDDKCNVAYWIDAAGRQFMCHKVGDDGTKIYEPCTEYCDEQNPIDCINARIGALVCMDSTDQGAQIKRRRETLMNQLRARTSTRVVCVPARFKTTSSAPSQEFSGCWHVVASGIWQCRSFVADGSGRIQIEANGQNEVKICSLKPSALP